MFALRLLLTAALALVSSPAFAGPQVATLAALQGEVKIFSHPSPDTPQGPPPHAKFEGLYYSVRDAKVGDRVEKGCLIRTQTGGRVRVIYDNGDQIYVAAASSYKIEWDKDTNDANPELELRYGKARFVIQKGGPRSKFRIKTKSAVLGVRGTDFFVAVNEATGETETATLRGAVEVKPPIETAQPTTVSAGQTASVAPPPEAAAAPKPPEVQLHQTTKAELQAVQRNTVLSAPEPTPPPAVEQVKTLEAAAEKATIEDIRAVDPAAAQKLEQLPAGQPHLDQINQSTIDQLSKKAPVKGAVGPIADPSLEKPAEKPPGKPEDKDKKDEKKSEAEEPEPILPRLWVGLKFGPHGSRFDGSNNNVSNGATTEFKEKGSASLAGTVEWELGRNFSLYGELFPVQQHGGELSVYCVSGSGCPGTGYGQYKITIKSLDWSFGLRPTIPFGRSRWFAIHFIVGGLFSHFTSAQMDHPDGYTEDIYQSISHDHLSVTGGVGVTLRPWSRFKVSVELRGSHTVGDVSNTPFVTGPMSNELRSIADVYGLLGVAIGL